jgi:hypothetical protein
MWEEYLSFEFHHSRGLGIGAEVPKPIEPLGRRDKDRAAWVGSTDARLAGVLTELQDSARGLDRAGEEHEELKSAVEREVRVDQALPARVEGLEQAPPGGRADTCELQHRVLAPHQKNEAYRRQLDAVTNSTIRRRAAPLRTAARKLPRSARLAYCGLAPWAIPRRLRAVRNHVPDEPPPALPPISSSSESRDSRGRGGQ